MSMPGPKHAGPGSNPGALSALPHHTSPVSAVSPLNEDGLGTATATGSIPSSAGGSYLGPEGPDGLEHHLDREVANIESFD